MTPYKYLLYVRLLIPTTLWIQCLKILYQVSSIECKASPIPSISFSTFLSFIPLQSQPVSGSLTSSFFLSHCGFLYTIVHTEHTSLSWTSGCQCNHAAPLPMKVTTACPLSLEQSCHPGAHVSHGAACTWRLCHPAVITVVDVVPWPPPQTQLCLMNAALTVEESALKSWVLKGI